MVTHPTAIPPEKRYAALKDFLLKQVAVVEKFQVRNSMLVPEGAAPFLYLTYPWFGEPQSEEQRKLLETRRDQFRAGGFDGEAAVRELRQIMNEDTHLRECCPTVGELSQFLDNFFFEFALQILRAGASPDRVESFFENEFIPLTYHQGSFKSVALSHLFNFDATQPSLIFGNVRIEKLEGRIVASFFGEPTPRSFFHPLGTGDFFIVSEREGPCDDWVEWLFDEKHRAEQFATVLQYFKDGVVHVDFTVPYFLPHWVNQIRKWGTFFLGNPRRTPYGKGKSHYGISAGEIERITAWWKAYTLPEVAERLKEENIEMRQAGMRAGEYFEYSHTQESVVARLIGLAISLESLFSPRDPLGELTFRISQYASQLVGTTKEEREELYSSLKKFYRLRSNLFHGQYDVEDYYKGKFVTHEECDKWASIIRRAILQFLVLFLRGQNSREEVLNDLAKAALDPELAEALRQKSNVEIYLTELKQRF